jgi:hypothetical protein
MDLWTEYYLLGKDNHTTIHRFREVR